LTEYFTIATSRDGRTASLVFQLRSTDIRKELMVAACFPIQGFLGTGGTFEADLNLVLQFLMGGALVAGALLARRKRYAAHGICQTTVLFLNLGMIGLVMWPSFHQHVTPALPRGVHKWYYAAATVHAILGSMAELLGLYIVIVAGTRVLPQSLRFKNWKRWMRAELMLWSVVVLTGVGTYCAWYIAPFR
jgi:uncharacterized membrane protein YozB (DUF420 family)